MSDSATIELSRDCGVDGVKRAVCSGKQDLESIQNELMCNSERENAVVDNLMKISANAPEATKIVKNMTSDNNENNNIDNFANQIEATIEKVGDKFLLEDVMMGDEPFSDPKSDLSSNEDKPVKAARKIAMEKPMKNNPKQTRKMKETGNLNKDDFMMGDQPIANIEQISTTTEVRNRRETDQPVTKSIASSTTESSNKVGSTATHAKGGHESLLKAGNYFLPPMLLVQHQNSTPAPHATETSSKDNTNSEQSTTITTTEISLTTNVPILNTSNNQIIQKTEETTLEPSNQSTTQSNVGLTAADVISSTQSSNIESNNSSDDTANNQSTTTQATTITTQTQLPNSHEHSNKPVQTSFMRPHAPKHAGEILFHSPFTGKTSNDPAAIHSNNSEASLTALSSPSANETLLNNETTATSVEQSNVTTQSAIESTTVTEAAYIEVAKRSSSSTEKTHNNHSHDENVHEKKPDAPGKHADFTNSNADNFYRYKPIRRRVLTKPETHTYIQKIFG